MSYNQGRNTQTSIGVTSTYTRSNHKQRKLQMVSSDSTSNAPLKRCSKCKQEFPATTEYFSPNKYTKSGFQSACKTCRNKMNEITRRKKGQRPRENPVVNGMKHCINCGNNYPNTLDYFYKNKTAKGGIGNVCIECILQASRDWYANNRERGIATRRVYYAKNNESIKRYTTQWGRKNPDKRKRYIKNYLDKNPSAIRIYNTTRRARKKSLPDTFSIEEWRLCLDWWGHKCAYCNNPQGMFKFQQICADHFVPLTSEYCIGTVAKNIVPACTSCNTKKSNSEPTTWILQTFGKRKGKKIIADITAYFAWVKSQEGSVE